MRKIKSVKLVNAPKKYISKLSSRYEGKVQLRVRKPLGIKLKK